MPRQAIIQADCLNCDNDNCEFTVMNRDAPNMDDDGALDSIVYTVRSSCGETGEITVDEEGTHSGDGITHENASWNQDEEDDE